MYAQKGEDVMPSIKTKNANRLIRASSPYLLQHAHHPIDWYPWSDEAFDRAQREDKPIFLSIGYSTCHWCHVMARESFEDEGVAELLNRYYIAVKVDREERPDVDQIYMAACQAIIGQGGWPLTVIMTPDQKPFFVGTYFPKTGRWGRPGLMDILKEVVNAWGEQREQINNRGSEVVYHLQNAGREREGPLNERILDEAYRELEESFDEKYGGFGFSTKFPLPHNLLFLLRYWKVSGEGRALEIVKKTLHSMARSGLYDHLGFGFHRYATDRRWAIPHFEKTLYDNALLAFLYVEAYQATGEEEYRRVGREIFTYIQRKMTSPEKAFFTAEDADSEGREGEFYLWTPGQVKEILGSEEGEVFCQAYGVTSRGDLRGKSILRLNAELGEAGQKGEILKKYRERLWREREKRVHPGKDDKILTSWNGLMIAALARGSQVLGDKKLAGMAADATHFILSKLRTARGRLLAVYREGVADQPAYVDDYAFLSWGLLELYGAIFEPWCLREAIELTRQLLSLFWDTRGGGLYFSGSDGEELIVRNKEIYDGAIPSGNAVACYNLLRLAKLTGDQQLKEKADQIFSAFGREISRAPSAHTFLMMALLFATAPSTEIIITGSPEGGQTKAMIQRINRYYLPHRLVVLHPGGDTGKELGRLVPMIKRLPPPEDNKSIAYLCSNFTCREPITDLDRLTTVLEGNNYSCKL